MVEKKNPTPFGASRKQDSKSPSDYVYQPEYEKMLGNMVLQAKSDESDTIVHKGSPNPTNRNSKATRQSNSTGPSPSNTKKKDRFDEIVKIP